MSNSYRAMLQWRLLALAAMAVNLFLGIVIVCQEQQPAGVGKRESKELHVYLHSGKEVTK